MPINTTGNHQIDQATAEIATMVRSYSAWEREQDAYDEAERLRNEIIVGTLERAGILPKWVTGVNGTSKRPWFLIRGHGTDSGIVPLRARYYTGPSGKLVRFASFETAQRAADKLNEEKS
jgi:hypothetical protein